MPMLQFKGQRGQKGQNRDLKANEAKLATKADIEN